MSSLTGYLLSRLLPFLPTRAQHTHHHVDTLTIEPQNTEIDLPSLRSAFITTVDIKKRISLSPTMKLCMLEHADSISLHRQQTHLSSLSLSPSCSCDSQRNVHSHGLSLCPCRAPSCTYRSRRGSRHRPSTSCFLNLCLILKL